MFFKVTVSLAAALLCCAPLASADPQQAPEPASETFEISDIERAKIETVLVELLMREPEIVVAAFQNFRRQQQVAEILPNIEPYRDFLEKDPSYPVLGNPDGDVTIVEFFDYRCGYCKSHFPALMALVKDDGNIRYIPRQFPVLDREGQPPVSRNAARAAVALHKQGLFAAFHEATLGYQGQLTNDSLYDIAGAIGADIDQMKKDMLDPLVEKTITTSLAVGQDIGFSGTPSYIIGKDVALGAEGYASLKAKVAAARSAATATTE